MHTRTASAGKSQRWRARAGSPLVRLAQTTDYVRTAVTEWDETARSLCFARAVCEAERTIPSIPSLATVPSSPARLWVSRKIRASVALCGKS